MVSSCSAFNCTSRFVKGGNLKFHCFPKDAALRKKWIGALRRKDFVPSTRAVICSKHFKNSDYVQTYMDSLRLKKDAVPSIFDFPEQLLKVERSRRILTKRSHCKYSCIITYFMLNYFFLLSAHIEDSEPSSSCDNPPTLTGQAKVDEPVSVRINRKRYAERYFIRRICK
nr:unnamed protein product [Callosobruchus analis]